MNTPAGGVTLPELRQYPRPDENGQDTGPCCAHAHADGWNECHQAFMAALESIALGNRLPGRATARAALAGEWRVPEGWRLVPVEATEAMVEATWPLDSYPNDNVSAWYAAMVAAAPLPKEPGR